MKNQSFRESTLATGWPTSAREHRDERLVVPGCTCVVRSKRLVVAAVWVIVCVSRSVNRSLLSFFARIRAYTQPSLEADRLYCGLKC